MTDQSGNQIVTIDSGTTTALEASSGSSPPKKLQRLLLNKKASVDDLKEAASDMLIAYAELNGRRKSALEEEYKRLNHQYNGLNHQYNEGNNQLSNVNHEKNVWKEKFHKVKTPEVLRTEIEKGKDLLPHTFTMRQKDVDAKKGKYAKTREEWYQRWQHLFFFSNHDNIVSLRNSFLLAWIESPEVVALGLGKEVKQVGKQLRQILQNDPRYSYDLFVFAKLEILFETQYCTGLMLEEILEQGPRDESHWFAKILDEVSIRVGEIQGIISEKIHKSKFESKDEVPTNYIFITDKKYQWCATIFLSNHSNDFEEDEEDVDDD